MCVRPSVCPSPKPPAARTHGRRVSLGLLHKPDADVALDWRAAADTQIQEELLPRSKQLNVVEGVSLAEVVFSPTSHTEVNPAAVSRALVQHLV